MPGLVPGIHVLKQVRRGWPGHPRDEVPGGGHDRPVSPMTSNFKGKSTSREAPTEPFKRSVAACLKAIARKPELEVGYAAERPGFAGGKARLPEPPRKLTAAEAAIVRGHADSIALKLACHDPNVHRRMV